MNTTSRENILNFHRLPAILSAEETAVRLGVGSHDIPTLCNKGLLRPLGSPTKNAPKQFAAVEIEEKASDVRWLSKVTEARTDKWRKKNAGRFSKR